MTDDTTFRSFDETPEERAQRIRERADEARPNVSVTPGQAETLKRSATPERTEQTFGADAAIEREQVIEAARAWRRSYLHWVRDPHTIHEQRDLTENGENLALSELLDALETLDAAEAKA